MRCDGPPEPLTVPCPAWIAPRRLAVGGLLVLMAVGLMSPAWSQEPAAGEIGRLIEVLRTAEDPGEATGAAQRLARFGPDAAAAIPALIDALSDGRGDVRDYAAHALSEIGVAAVEPLAEAARTARSADARIYAMDALGRIGPAAAAAAPTLISLLTDRDGRVSRHAMDRLPRLGIGAVPDLRVAITARDPVLRRRAAFVLGAIGRKSAAAIPELLQATEDSDLSVRRNAMTALGAIGEAQGDVVARLTAVLNDIGENSEAREAAAEALGRIAPQDDGVVRSLIAAMDSGDYALCNAAATALGRVPAYAAQTVPPLIDALKDPRYAPARGFAGCGKAISALGRLGAASVAAIPQLAAELSGIRGYTMREDIEDSIDSITLRLQSEADTLADGALRDAITFLEDGRDLFQSGALYERLDGTARLLTLTLQSRWTHRLKEALDWLAAHKIVAGVAAYVIFVPLLCFLILWLRPLWILRINDFLKPLADVRLPGWLGGIKVPVSTVLLVGLFHYHPRVLDGWVAAHVATARRRFRLKDTVANREVHVDVPLILDGDTVPDFSSRTLRPIFKRRLSCTLIRGEGGSGKTSLACQVARWAMSDAPEERPADHVMLPILIEHELDFTVGSEDDPLTVAIGRQLQDLIESPSPIRPELLDRLLRQRRVLVIVDHLSEMSEATSAKIQPGAPNFPANALIVTSRLDEDLGGVVKSLIQPLRIAGNRLSSFMEAYLVKRGKRDLLDDQAFFDGCSRLSAMVGNRRITVLLAKLYAEQMVATAEDIDGAAQPQSIPDLMLQYLNRLNRSIAENRLDDRVVHADAKVVAWQCLEHRFRPGEARIDDVVMALGGADAEARLDYLVSRLRLVQVLQPAQDRVRIVLDPLAEYLAGLHIVGTLGSTEKDWRSFFERVESAPGSPEAVRGFVLAVLDCCRADDGHREPPDFVAAECARLAGLGLDRPEHDPPIGDRRRSSADSGLVDADD